MLIIVDPSCNYIGFDEVESNEVEVFPNPTRDILNIRNSHENELIISLMDINQKIIETKTTKAFLTELSLDSYSTGLYFIRIERAGLTKTFKIIKN